jgi:PAS domain S-box-containing protein
METPIRAELTGAPPDALGEPLELYRLLFQTAPQGMVIQGADGAVLAANAAAERFLGLSLEQMAGRAALDFPWACIREDGSPCLREALPGMEALVTGRRVENVVLGVANPRPGGTTWLEVSAIPLFRAGEPSPFRVFSTFQDITERREAEDALRTSEEKFALAFNASPDSININRLEDGVYIAVNDGFSRITGYASEEVLGRSSLPGDLGLWVDPEDRARLQEGLEREGMVQSLEASFRRKDGTVVIGLMSASLIQIQGQPCILSLARDITERKQAESERRQLEDQLRHAQKMESLGSLAGGVAHDMNNVLGAILGLASANLEAMPAGSQARGAFETIASAAVRGGKLVKSLLTLARQSPAEERDLDLNTVLREETGLLERTTFARVRFELDLCPGLRPIRGDASALNLAFMNLCVNAVDAMAGGGTLTLRSRNLDDDWVEVMVEDTGCGMARAVLERAVDPFFTTKPVGKGTGLGLAMVYSTVKAHRGQLEIQSEPGRGTRVRARFPACGPAAEVPQPAAAPQASAQAGLKVLLVDDDELIQSTVQSILEILGHAVTMAPSGEEALRELEAGLCPDVVILDMNMPGLGGTGTLPRLRALRPEVPVLLATGRVDQAALDLVRLHPKVTLLPKPFTMGELKQHLEG